MQSLSESQLAFKIYPKDDVYFLTLNSLPLIYMTISVILCHYYTVLTTLIL